MATTTSLTTTYAGKLAAPYLLGAMKAIKSLEFITVKENLEYKTVVKKLVNAISFAAPTCDFTPTGTVTITERILTLEEFQVQENLCKKDFFTDWNYMVDSGGGQKLPQELSDAVIENMAAAIAENEENIIWQGVNATTGQHDGFITLMLADSAVIDVSSADAITASTIIADLARTLAASIASTKGPALHGSAEMPEFYISPTLAVYYKQAQAALGNGTYYQQKDVILEYIGYKLNVCPGMPANTMVLARPSNLWFGTNKKSDLNEIIVADMGQWAEQNVRFSWRGFFGCQYGFGDEITLYRYPENS